MTGLPPALFASPARGTPFRGAWRNAVHAARNAPPLRLGEPGFSYSDLFDPKRLADLSDAFEASFKATTPDAWAAFAAYRACRGEGMTPEARSEVLLSAAPHVSAFVRRLFRVEAEATALAQAVQDRSPLWRFKRDFVRKRVTRKGAGEGWDAAAAHPDAVAIAALRELDATLADELSVARAVLALSEVEDVWRKARKAGGAQWTEPLRQLGRRIASAVDRAAAGGLQSGSEPSDDALGQACAHALLAIEAYLVERHRAADPSLRGWVSLRVPHGLQFDALVPLRRPAPDTVPEWFVGRDEDRRQRPGFRLTDTRASAVEVESEVDYCLLCHDRDKDSCSKGLRENKTREVKSNPLGVKLTGCPLEEKISEMHTMRRDGDVIAALALVCIDNPMLPGTGHRICNDCMKACVYQKQEPVNIPQIETRVLSEVLSLPWGLEIYGLLTRWNPLAVSRPAIKPYTGRKVLVVGLGPAGYTLAHHLASEGFGVVAVDGLKLEPLPEELTGVSPWVTRTEAAPSTGTSNSGTMTGQPIGGVPSASATGPLPIRDAQTLTDALDERTTLGFGGVSEYGITVRWDKNFLSVLYLTLARHPHLRMLGGVRFGGTLTLDDAWALGFDHVALAAGAGKPTIIDIKNNLARGIRKASDFLMGLQLSGAFKRDSMANLQVSLPAIVIGGGLTAIDTATELAAYYVVQVEKEAERHRALSRDLGEDQVRAMFDDEEWEVLREHLEHASAIRTERARAAAEGRAPELQRLVDGWGGVSIVYRKGLTDSPAYRLNHEEVHKSLEEGVRYYEHLSPIEAKLDAHGSVRAMVFKRTDGTLLELPARTVCVAAGTSPNVTYAREHEGTFALDAKQQYFQAHRATRAADGTIRLEAASVSPGSLDASAMFTSYVNGHRTVSFYGDNHPAYAGSVVRAMASAKDGHPRVAALFPEVVAADARTAPDRRGELAQFFAKLTDELSATVREVNRLTSTIVEVVVHAPLAARRFQPGQFYRLQNFEAFAPEIDGTRLVMEGLALTGAWIDEARGLMGTIVLEMGASSDLCAALTPGEPVVLMGPTGAPTEVPPHEDVILCGGGLGNAVLFSIARAYKAIGSRVLYFAGYKRGEDLFKQDDLEQYTDQIVYCTDGGAQIAPRRPQDRHIRANIVEAMVAYAEGKLGPATLPMKEARRIIAIGSDRMMNAVRQARHGVLAAHLDPSHVAIGSINSPMQCMMKEICAQCLQRHRDPVTGKETMVFSCFNQDQELDRVDFDHLASRLRVNSMQEKLSRAWLKRLLAKAPTLVRV